MSVPKLRFKEFESTVEVRKLGNISNIVVGFVGTVSDQYCDQNEGIPFVRTQNVRDGYFSIENLEYVTRDFHKKNKKSQIFNGDVLIARVGANMGMVCAVENLDTEANCANVIIIKNNPQLNSQYLSLFLNSENGQKQIHSGGAGGAQAVFNTTLAKEISFPYFPLNEQTKIASFLSAVAEKISQLTQKHELLSQYKQGMMQKSFSQQIRFKAEDGSEFGEWEETTLGAIVQIRSGYSPSKYNLENEGVIPFLKVEELNNCIKFQSKSRFYTSEASNDLVWKDSIIFPKRGAAILNNKVRILEENALLDSNLMALIPSEKIFYEYLYYIITYIELFKIADTSSIPQINNKHIEPYSLELPCLEEQTKIANFLSSIDQKIEVVAQQIEQAKQWKKGLLQQMFV